MAALATLAGPRLVAVTALLGLTLASGHDTHPELAREPARSAALVVPQPLGRVIAPGRFADAREWQHGMVIAPPATGDAIAFGVVPAPLPPGPVATLLSGLFDLLGSRGA